MVWRATCERVPADHPGVLRAAALRAVDDEFALGQRHAGEAAGQHPDVVAVVDGERAQVGVPRAHAVVDERRDGGQLHDRLGDPAARVLQQPPRARRVRPCDAAGPDHEALAARAVDGLDDELVEPVEHLLERARVFEPPGVDVRQDRLLAEVVPDQVGQVGVDELVVGDAVADRVGDRHVAQPRGQQQSWAAEHRVGAELQRVEELVVDAAVDHVDPRGAGGRAHPDPPARAEQVAALDEFDAHEPREQGVLEVGGVEDAGREHHDGRVVDPRRRARAQRLRAACAGSRRPGAPASRRRAPAGSAP